MLLSATVCSRQKKAQQKTILDEEIWYFLYLLPVTWVQTTPLHLKKFGYLGSGPVSLVTLSQDETNEFPPVRSGDLGLCLFVAMQLTHLAMAPVLSQQFHLAIASIWQPLGFWPWPSPACGGLDFIGVSGTAFCLRGKGKGSASQQPGKICRCIILNC